MGLGRYRSLGKLVWLQLTTITAGLLAFAAPAYAGLAPVPAQSAELVWRFAGPLTLLLITSSVSKYYAHKYLDVIGGIVLLLWTYAYLHLT